MKKFTEITWAMQQAMSPVERHTTLLVRSIIAYCHNIEPLPLPQSTKDMVMADINKHRTELRSLQA
jgi:hypothetical protein